MNNNRLDRISRQVATANGDILGEWPEHDWQLDDDGNIDLFGMEYDYHNGPRCVRCGYSYCHHCEKGPTEPCVVKPKSYARYLFLLLPVVDKWSKKTHIGWSLRQKAGRYIAEFEGAPDSLRGIGATPEEALAIAWIATKSWSEAQP